MAPSKKKDKAKHVEWLQCSLSGKLICPEDAEVHSKPGTADYPYIQDKVLCGKVINAENLLGEDGVSVIKSIRDQDSVVWLAVQTMQMCGLSIGQPCVISKVVVKRAWPHKSLPLSSVALSKTSRDELGVCKDKYVTVERFMPNDMLVVNSANLVLRDDNHVFETQEFALFAAAYLDGKFICEGSPLLIRYFGQICLCSVSNLKYHKPAPVIDNLASPLVIPSSSNVGTVSFSTPMKRDGNQSESSICSTPVSGSAKDESLPSASPNQDLSDSLASLNISSSGQSSSFSSTPIRFQRENYPNLFTPVKGGQIHCPPLPNVFAQVSSQGTVFSVYGPSSKENRQEENDKTSLKDIGGLSVQIDELKARIGRALHTDSTSHCLLLYGPAGTGKSLLVKAIINDLGLPTHMLTGTDIWSKLFGEAESNLQKVFKTAQDKAPSLIVIDDIHVICPKLSQNSSGQQEHRIVGTLLSLIDSISSSKNSLGSIAVLGITNNREGLDPALRRAGRFSYEIEIGIPTAPQRFEILQCLLKHVPHNLSDSEIKTVAGNAHGYVGADLSALVNEASMHSMTSRKRIKSEEKMSLVTLDDLVYAGLHVKPSALREIQLEVPQVHWSDIGGMQEVKTRLQEAVELPLSHPEIFKNLGIEPPRGLLMYGPPGCSKTMVARAVATECKLNFLAVKGPELFNQYVGESEKAIREVFRKARSAAPSVIFFDEIDAIAAKRGSSSGGSGVDDRVLTQLLTEMDGLEFLKDVFIMAATNRPDKIDNALLRPGRFDSLVYVPLPDADARLEILQKKFEKMAVAENVSVDKLVEATQDYSGAEVVQVCQEAAMYALRETLDASKVEKRHFEAALKKVNPQINLELLNIYNKFKIGRAHV